MIIVGSHIVVLVVSRLLIWHWSIIVSSSYAASMRCPIQFEVAIFLSRDLFAIKSGEDISRSIVVLKLNKAIANRLIGLLILDQFDIDNFSNTVKLHRNVLLSHIR